MVVRPSSISLPTRPLLHVQTVADINAVVRDCMSWGPPQITRGAGNVPAAITTSHRSLVASSTYERGKNKNIQSFWLAPFRFLFFLGVAFKDLEPLNMCSEMRMSFSGPCPLPRLLPPASLGRGGEGRAVYSVPAVSFTRSPSQAFWARVRLQSHPSCICFFSSQRQGLLQ